MRDIEVIDSELRLLFRGGGVGWRVARGSRAVRPDA